MAKQGAALIRDLPPVVDLRPVPKEPPPAPELRSRVIETPPGPDGRPRAPRREVELAVPGYPGHTAWVWSNFPQKLRLDLDSGDEARLMAALRRILVEVNGWCDQDGEPYPPADDPAFWESIPQELGTVLYRLILVDAPLAFPKALQAQAGR